MGNLIICPFAESGIIVNYDIPIFIQEGKFCAAQSFSYQSATGINKNLFD